MNHNSNTMTAGSRAVGEFQGYVDGQPSVTWFDRDAMPEVGAVIYAVPRSEKKATAFMPRRWSLLLTSENHGTVGPAGSTFPHAGEKHERVVVVELVDAGAPPAPGVDLAGLVQLEVGGPLGDAIRRDSEFARHIVEHFAGRLPATPGAASGQITAAQAGQVAAAEELARFCPACGRVGEVGSSYRDCCPDGNEARRIPKSLAEKCRKLFKAALNSGAAAGQVAVPFDFLAHLARQAAWSEKTFGPGARTKGVCDHIRKELLEIEADPLDLREWIDVVILGLDGAWRCGGTPEQIIAGIAAKQAKNEGRTWPDWRTADPDKAIEHDRTFDAAMQASTPGERQEGGAA